MKAKKLTPALLRKMIISEKRKFLKEGSDDPIASGVEDPAKIKAKEVDADDLSNTLEKDIDHLKVLKVEERKIRAKLKAVTEIKNKLRSRILRKL